MSNDKKYFIEEGKSLSTKIGNVGPHEEITTKLIGGENPQKMIDKHLKNKLLYEADEPRIDAAAKVKADRNKALKDEVGAVEKLELANKKIKDLEGKIKASGDGAIKDELKDKKKELSEANTALEAAEKVSDDATEAHDATKTELAEANAKLEAAEKELEVVQGNLDASEELIGETQVKLSEAETAHEATKKELEKLKKK